MFEHLFEKGGLSLERLRSFMQMALAGSIAKAAPGNASRQSQISRQIRELEQFFSTELTCRRGRTLALSPAGARLARLIRQQLKDMEDFRQEQAGRPKSFVIGSGASVLEWLVTPALPKVSRLLGGAVLMTESHRSRSLVEAVQDGRVDLAVVRKNALPRGAKCALIQQMSFHLCIPRRLLRGGKEADAQRPALWQRLPFAAGRDGGQTDQAVRAAMRGAGVDFRPCFECGSMLQVLQLVKMGACAAVMPGLAVRGLDLKDTLVLPFAPLKDFGRSVVLHWNERQMERRNVPTAVLRQAAAALKTAS